MTLALISRVSVSSLEKESRQNVEMKQQIENRDLNAQIEQIAKEIARFSFHNQL
jgi:hypothetical protein